MVDQKLTLQVAGYLSGILNLPGGILYLIDILKGTTKPERASWFIWMVLGLVAFATQKADGATYSLWLTKVQTTGVVIVFILSLWRGVGGFVWRDIIALAAIGVGLILWYLTHLPVTALTMVIAVDAVGSLIALIKAYQDPYSETLIAWVFWALGGLCGMVAVGQLNGTLLAYPTYIFLANSAVFVAQLCGRRAKRRVTS